MDYLNNLNSIQTEWVFAGAGCMFLLQAVVFSLIGWLQRRKRNRLIEELNRSLSNGRSEIQKGLADLGRMHQAVMVEFQGALGRTQSVDSPTETAAANEAFSALDKKHQVFSLARQGFSTSDISRRLNLYEGETELVLGLRKLFTEAEKNDASSVAL
jgi:hypothetical protein